MTPKVFFYSLSISALMLSVMTSTSAFAAISGDTDLITIEEERSSCNPDSEFFTFALFYSFVGMPTPNSGWFRTELVSSDGVGTLIHRDWSSGVAEQGVGGGGIETSLDVGSEPYTLTVYEAVGPDPAGSGPFNDETVTAKEGGWTASVTFTCADLDRELNPPPEPLTADIRSSNTEGDAPLTVEFQAVVTGGTQPYTYSWDFGDGTTEEESIEPATSHTYEEPGTYTVTLTVIDSEGQEAADSLEVTVSEPPEPSSDPAQATEELISDVQNLEGVSQGTKTSLTAPLRGVVNILSDDNPNNDNSACGRFGAFMNQVNANERRGSVTEDQAVDLRTQAEDIRGMLDC